MKKTKKQKKQKQRKPYKMSHVWLQVYCILKKERYNKEGVVGSSNTSC